MVVMLVFGFAQVILITNALSLGGGISPDGFLLGQVLLLGIVASVLLRWRGYGASVAPENESRGSLTRFERVLVVLLAGLFIYAAAVAVVVAPNSVDSMTYHLTRVGFWLQQGSLEHYPTADPRQVEFPFNAEILMMHSMLFLRSDRLVAFTQLLSCAGSASLAFLTARR